MGSLSYEGLKIANICGSCGKKAIPLALLGADVTVFDISEENMTGAYSRIMDADMADEMTEYSKNQVLVQASTSMSATMVLFMFISSCH